MIAGSSRFLSLVLTVFSLFGFAIHAQGATPFAGFYSGNVYIALSGSVTVPERSVGIIGITIKEDGSVVSSGDLAGSVDTAGVITWVTPNSLSLTTGTVAEGVINSTGSKTDGGLTTTYRVSASNMAPGFSGNSPLAGRVEQVNPKQTASDLIRIRHGNGKFMAAGARGTVAFSNDGLNWSRVGLSTTLSLFDIAYGNGMYVAVGDSGVVFTSPDGLTWTARSVGFSPFTGVAFGNGIFMRTTFTGALQTSTDGISWVTPAVPSATGAGYAGLDFVNDRFVIYNGNVVMTADGTAALSTGSPGVGNLGTALAAAGRIAFGNGVYVAAGSTGVAYSADGVTWTKASGPSLRTDAIGFGNGLFAIMDSAKHVWISPDGAAWEFVGDLDGAVSTIGFGAGRFIAGGEKLHTSIDGKTWFQPADDGAAFDTTAFYVNTSSFQKQAYHVGFSIADPQFGPPNPAPIRGVLTPRTFSIARFWVGDNGYIFYYAGNTNFIENGVGVGPRLTDRTLRAAAPGNSGWVLIAGDGGTLIRVTRPNSIKGPEFELITSPTTADLLSGAPNIATGSGVMFVGTGGTIIHSSLDGKTATVKSSPVTATLRHVYAYGSGEGFGGLMFIAVGDNGSIITSTDGSVWTRRDSGVTANFVGSGYASGRFLAAGEDGTVVQSTDGLTWTAHPAAPVAHRLTTFGNADRSLPGGGVRAESLTIVGPATGAPSTRAYFKHGYDGLFGLNRAALGNGRWVIVGQNRTGASIDGKTWTFQAQSSNFSELAFGLGKFVAVTPSGLATSVDGLNWTFKSIPGLSDIAYSNGRFVAVGTKIYTSDDTETWTERAAPGAGYQLVAGGDGKFSTTGGSGVSAYSNDNGTTWLAGGGGAQSQQAMTFGNGRFVTVGGDGRYAFSTDGRNFSAGRLNGPTTAESRPLFYNVLFHNGLFYACTFGGSLYTSTDGSSWSILHTGISVDLQAMAAGNGLMLLAGGREIHLVTLPDTGGPAVAEQPEDKSVVEGGSLTLSADFTGEDLEFTWFKDGSPLVDGARISGATTRTLTISGVVAADAGEYTLVAANFAGSRATRAAVVAVAIKPAIAAQPQSLAIELGQIGSLSVNAYGGEISYQWFRNGLAISGAVSDTYTIDATTGAAAGVYHVELSNLAGRVTSAPAGVSVYSRAAGWQLDPSWPAQPLSFAPNPYFSTIAVQPNGKIIASGFFTLNKPAGGTMQHLVRLNSDGTFDPTFNPGTPDSQVDGFYFLPNGQILASGYFDKLGTVSTKGFARLNDDGSLDSAFAPNIGPAYSGPLVYLPRADGKVVVGGPFTTFGGVPIKFLGLIDGLTGQPDTSFVPSIFGNQITRAAFLNSGSIIVGGSFTTPSRLARVSSTGQIDATFNAGQPGLATDANFAFLSVEKILVLPGDKVLVGGHFGRYNGQAAVGLMRLNADGSLDSSLSLGLNTAEIPRPRVNDIYPVGDSFLVAGRFLTVRGDATRKNLVMIDSAGQITSGLNLTANPDLEVQMIRRDHLGNLLIMGAFSTVDGQSRQLLARLISAGGESLPLEIASQPRPVDAREGGAAVFAVAARGHGNITYQWKRGDAILPGQNAPTLILADVRAADAGEYSVVVADANGSVTSEIVRLTVDGGGGFASWAAANLPPGQQGPTDDPDNDGLPNVAEYVFGSNPTASDAARPRGASVNVGGQFYPAVQFTRSATATGVSVQATASLTVDFPTAEATVETVEPLGGGLERVTIRAANPGVATFYFKIEVTVN